MKQKREIDYRLITMRISEYAYKYYNCDTPASKSDIYKFVQQLVYNHYKDCPALYSQYNSIKEGEEVAIKMLLEQAISYGFMPDTQEEEIVKE